MPILKRHLLGDQVDGTKIEDNAVSLEHMDTGAKPVFHVIGAGTFTTVGGDATESITATGAAVNDTVVVWVQKAGATPRTVDTAVAASNAITVTLSGNPSTDHVLGWLVIRAAS